MKKLKGPKIHMSDNEYENAVALKLVKYLNTYTYYYFATRLDRLYYFMERTTLHYVEDDKLDAMIHPQLLRECGYDRKAQIQVLSHHLSWFRRDDNENIPEVHFAILINASRILKGYKKVCKERYDRKSFMYDYRTFSINSFCVYYLTELYDTMTEIYNVATRSEGCDVLYKFIHDKYITQVIQDATTFFNLRMSCRVISPSSKAPVDKQLGSPTNKDTLPKISGLDSVYNTLFKDAVINDIIMAYIPTLIQYYGAGSIFRSYTDVVNILLYDPFVMPSTVYHTMTNEPPTAFVYEVPVYDSLCVKRILFQLSFSPIDNENFVNEKYSSLGSMCINIVEAIIHEVRHFLQFVGKVDKLLIKEDITCLAKYKDRDKYIQEQIEDTDEQLTHYTPAQIEKEEDAIVFAMNEMDRLMSLTETDATKEDDKPDDEEKKVHNPYSNFDLSILYAVTLSKKWKTMIRTGLNQTWLEKVLSINDSKDFNKLDKIDPYQIMTDPRGAFFIE